MSNTSLQAPSSGHVLDLGGDLSIEALLDDFLKSKHRSLNTQRTYKTALLQYLAFSRVSFASDLHPVSRNPSEMGQLMLDWLETLTIRDDQDKERIRNARTINNKAASVSSFFQWLVDVHSYPKNPIRAIYEPHKVKKKSTTESLSRGEIIGLLNYAKANHRASQKHYRDYLILLFGFGLALRRSELARIRIDDFGMTGNVPTVKVYRKGGEEEIQPVPGKLMALVNHFLESFPTKSHYLFRPVRNRATQDLDKPISTTGIFVVIRDMAATVLPGKNITPHSLRKTFVEIALNNGEDGSASMNATGWGSEGMLYYYDGRDALENNAIRGMGKFI